MGLFDEPIFDFNGDGETDAFEFAMGMMIMDELDEEERLDESSLFEEDEDFDGFDDSNEWL